MANATPGMETPDTASVKGNGNGTDEEHVGDICILDMGEHSRKRVKRLRKGRGKLMAKVERAIDELQAGGVLSPSAQTVIVIVREETSFTSLFDDDDDDD